MWLTAVPIEVAFIDLFFSQRVKTVMTINLEHGKNNSSPIRHTHSLSLNNSINTRFYSLIRQNSFLRVGGDPRDTNRAHP